IHRDVLIKNNPELVESVRKSVKASPDVQKAVAENPALLVIVQKDVSVIENPDTDKLLRENPELAHMVQSHAELFQAAAAHPIIVKALFNNPDITVEGLWDFSTYFLSFSILLIAFFLLLRFLTTAEGKKHVDATWWLVFLMIGSLLVSCFSYYGPLREVSPLEFPWDTVVILGVAIIAFIIGIKTGFETEDIKEIV